jgi:DNA-binding MarR family transcriptional regulator
MRKTTVADAVAPDQAVADATARLYLTLGRLARSLRRGSPSELGHSATATLATVVQLGPIRTGDLANREGVSAPTMTRIISALVSAGYVRRNPDPDDGRAWLVTASAEGERAVREVRSARSQVLLVRIQNLPGEQRAALLAALPALEALADDG